MEEEFELASGILDQGKILGTLWAHQAAQWLALASDEPSRLQSCLLSWHA